jgi:hypothetical protein
MVLLVLLAGCDGEVAPGGRDVLCPSCIPRSGGETSDFGGGQECQYEERAIADEPELEAELETTLAAYAGRFERKLRWSAPDSTLALTNDETTIRGNIELGDGKYLIGTPVECDDLIQLSATIELETADGGLQATSEGALMFRRADGASELTAVSDLSLARGSLELPIESTEPHVGRLSTSIVADAAEISGTVTIEVSYFADRASAEAAAQGKRAESTSELRVIGAF